MKQFIPNIRNEVCTVDGNGIVPLMKCSDYEECFYYCTRFNEGEKNDRNRTNQQDIYKRT